MIDTFNLRSMSMAIDGAEKELGDEEADKKPTAEKLQKVVEDTDAWLKERRRLSDDVELALRP